jgi:hypothetical protein
MPELLELGDRRSIESGDFNLSFRWTGARWEHWLEHRGRGLLRPRVLAFAVEGDAVRGDPARVISPAYQQLHFQREGEAVQALLVGQSGPHHFSAVFHFEDRASGEVRIGVDVADRCRSPIEVLASTYTVDARSDDLVGASPSLAAWDFEPARLTFSAVPPSQVSLAEAGRRATQVQALAPPDPGSPTRRFLYTWHWEPDFRR